MSEPGRPQLPGFAARIGIQLLSATAEEVVAELEPDDRHLGPAGDVHHGVHASLVETIASVGAWLAVEDRGQQVVGIANTTETLLAHTSGRLRARARPEHVGEREQLWSAEVRRAGDGALIASGQVRLWHVADRPKGQRST
jgi:1,4-dihydroxy-2-naphthoyl-CoA hydrolase